MIICCTKLLPDILRIYTDDDWTQIGDFETMDQVLDAYIQRDEKLIVLFSNPTPNLTDEAISFPPIHMLMRLIAMLLSIRHKLRDAVHFNIIHLQDENARNSVNTVLQYYTPANETHVVETKAEIAAIINENLNHSPGGLLSTT
jgi:hypothetical protein